MSVSETVGREVMVAFWAQKMPPYNSKKKVLIYLSYFLEMTYTHHMNLDEQNVALVIKDTAGEVSKFN